MRTIFSLLAAAFLALGLSGAALACGGNQCFNTVTGVGGTVTVTGNGFTFGDGGATASADGDEFSTFAETKAINLVGLHAEIDGESFGCGVDCADFFARFEGDASQVVLGLSHATAAGGPVAAATVNNFSNAGIGLQGSISIDLSD